MNHQAFKDLFTLSPSRTSNQQSVPGKLFISGEYAILFPKQPAILIAVNQYLHAHIQDNQVENQTTITSELLADAPLTFSNPDQLADINQGHLASWKYVIQALEVCRELLDSLHLPFYHFDLHFTTELINEAGLKFGLGSSGAVTVATIRSILAYHGVHAINNEIIYRLAAIVLIKLGSNGSLGDIAAISQGAWVYYQSFDREWLRKELARGLSLEDLLVMDWPDLIIESLTVSEEMNLQIGWTQKPASTDNLVADLLSQSPQENPFFQEFLKDAAKSVKELKNALIEANFNLIETEINNYRQLLLALSRTYELQIETKSLTELITIAHDHHYVAKSSGAGGGDCGIAIAKDSDKAHELQKAWNEKDIIPLNLKATSLIN